MADHLLAAVVLSEVVEHLGVVEYAVDWIIDLMGNTGRQFADRGELGGPQGFGFMAFFLGHVPGHQQGGLI